MIEQVTKFRTSDGLEFDTEEEAHEHEAGAADIQRLARFLESLPREGDDAVSDRARSRIGNAVMRFLQWERRQESQS